MAAGDVAEGHDRPERDASARIIAAHDRGAIIAYGIETRYGRAVVANDPADHIGVQSVESTEIAHYDLERVIGAVADRRDIRIRLVLGIAEVAVERGAATFELSVDTPGRAVIVVADGLFQAVG